MKILFMTSVALITPKPGERDPLEREGWLTVL